MIFSEPTRLGVEDIADLVVRKVLPKRPVEAAIPVSRSILAKTANLFPSLALKLVPTILARGRKRIKELRTAKR